jgi:CheY-like chemotaxis protein
MRAGPASSVVLVVEDEPLVLRDAANEFRARGWDVLEANSAEHAIALTADNTVDIEALRVRARQVPILYTSAHPSDPERAAACSSPSPTTQRSPLISATACSTARNSDTPKSRARVRATVGTNVQQVYLRR